MKLSAIAVRTKKTPGLYSDGGGLYLQVSSAGARSWIFRFQLNGRRRDMGLGSVSVFSLADAREKATASRRLVAEGIDPIERREAEARAAAKAAAAAVPFRKCAEDYIASMTPSWRNSKHAGQWSSTLETYAFPKLGGLTVGAIDTGLVCQVLEPIWTSKAETASRLRGRLEAILDFAKARGYRDGENPARWRGHLDHILPARRKVARVEHHASLPYGKLPAFWLKLQAADGFGARALELAILTAARSGEVFGARWAELDLEAKVWTIPGDRMKAGLEHRIPLTEPAVALLRKMAAIRTGDFVFPGQGGKRPLSNMAMTMVLRRLKVDVTPHGFRSTFRTWAAELTTYPAEVAEAALAHTQGALHAAYQRGDLLAKRRELMKAWGNFVTGVGADVVPLRKGA